MIMQRYFFDSHGKMKLRSQRIKFAFSEKDERNGTKTSSADLGRATKASSASVSFG